MTDRQKTTLYRIIAGALLLIFARLVAPEGRWEVLVYLVPYAVVGYDVLFKAVRNIARGKVFDENFLMALATVGALAIGDGPEAVFVMLFYQVGELFQSYAVGKSRRSIAQLMDIRPDYANVERDRALVRIDPDEAHVGDVIVIKAGERVPLDGVVLAGTSSLDTAALTGESAPRAVRQGDDVISGCVNKSGLLRVRVTKPFGESTVSRILDLVENASGKKAGAEQFITRFARYYTPVVVVAAALLALIGPIASGGAWDVWLTRALTFLVISCPCALVISVPLSFFGGIGGASRRGILVKGGNYLEALARTEIVVFDKTGTLTRGDFRVTGVQAQDGQARRLMERAALCERYSDHPIARSIREACEGDLSHIAVDEVTELAGRGVRARIEGQVVHVGNERLMEEIGAAWSAAGDIGTTVYVAVDGVYAGHIVISDAVKPDAKQAVSQLKAQGVRKAVMLTGDSRAVAEPVAWELGLDAVHAELLPADKVDIVETLLKEKSPSGSLAFVGDGINDAPVLARADIGIAMGALGSDAAIEAADIVLMDDEPSKVAVAVGIARKTIRIVKQNIAFALLVKAAVLVLGAMGYAGMWAAVFADVGVSVIAILNAMRALKA